MGQKDSKAKKFVSDNHVFADLVNYYVFHGKQVVKPENLVIRDPNEIVNVYGFSKKINSIQRNRDILKRMVYMTYEKMRYVIVGIENQSEIHYAMCVKNALYDAINYATQVEEAREKHNDEKDYGKSADFLSGFHKNDKLTPVITLTLYLGTDDWDAPRSLHEMMDLDEDLKEYVQDYRLNLIIPSEIEDFSLFQSDMRYVLEMLSVANDGTKFSKVLNENLAYSNLEPVTADMIRTFAGLNIRLRKNKEGKINMCKAINDIKDKATADGQKKGEIIGQEKTQEEMKLVAPYIKEGKDDSFISKALKIPVKRISRYRDILSIML